MPTYVGTPEEYRMLGKHQPFDLTAAQLEIMNIVWERGEVSVADVWDVLFERRGVARNTAQTMLSRLAERGLLVYRQHNTGGFRYSAAVSQEDVQRRLVQNMVDAAFGGSVEGLVMQLLDGGGVKPQELAKIHDMILRSKKGKKP